MTRFQIPDNALHAFTELSKLSTSESEKIGLLLQQFPLGGNIEDLKELLDDNQLFVDVPDMAETFFSFGSLLTNKKDISKDILAKKLSDAFAVKKKDEIGKDVVEQLEKNLLTFFESADSLTKTMKAIKLLTENAHIYHECGIMTDMRLLFNDNLETGSSCGVILHQLKIEYIENGKKRSFFVSMDKDDLTELSDVLQRALKKEEVILKNQSDIHFITLK